MSALEATKPPPGPAPCRLRSADPAALRILEVGDHETFNLAFPENTVRLSTRPKKRHVPDPYFTLARWREVKKELAAGRYDLVVCYTQLYAPWDPRSFIRAFSVGLPRPINPVVRTFGVMKACRIAGVPMITIDYDDSFAVNRHLFRFLKRSQLYFKRELPVDGWQLYFKTGHRNLPTRRIRGNPRYAAWLEKVRPISLGLPWPTQSMGPLPLEQKSADVFFAGQVTLNSTVREAGMRQLEMLAARGYRIDIARERLPYREFLARCARSWLTWSPEGYGWDCRRHYEAAFCRSVPLMSRATIHRHRPLVAGEHGFYYDVEGDGLIRAVEDALADKERLARIAEASRTHVLAHHTYEAICRYMVGELAAKLAGENAPGPVSG